jgi:hypothetical protein
MNKMNLFALLVIFGVLANLAFSQPQQRVDDDDWEDTWNDYSDTERLQNAMNAFKEDGWSQSCIWKCQFSTLADVLCRFPLTTFKKKFKKNSIFF